MSYQVFGLVMLTVFFWGITPVIEKTGFSHANVDPLIALTIRGIATIIGLAVMVVGMGRVGALFSVNSKAVMCFATSGLLAGLLGTWTYLMALKLSDASKVVPISATYPLVAALLSFFILREDDLEDLEG